MKKELFESILNEAKVKKLNEDFGNDTRTSVKIEFYGRDKDEVENIVEEVNETYNTVFNAYDLGKIISVESSALITSIALLEDILEEFLKHGASEIHFIKA